MKIIASLLLLFSSGILAQTEVVPPLEEEIEESNEAAETPGVENRAQVSRPEQSVFQIECQCPEPQAEEEATSASSIFPPDTVFFIAPEPAPVQAAPQQEVLPQQNENLPPGYGGKLPQGYSDESYQQIQ